MSTSGDNRSAITGIGENNEEEKNELGVDPRISFLCGILDYSDNHNFLKEETMKAWVKKNLFSLVAFMVLGGIWVLSMESCIERINYKKQIKALNSEIIQLKGDISESEARADRAIEESWIAVGQAMKERIEKEKHKTKEARLEKEKEGLQARIAALPPTEVVIHTIRILRAEPQEIVLQSHGVFFTLSAARVNLKELERFSLIERQYSELKISFAKSEASEMNLLLACKKKDIAIEEKDGQLAKWPEIEERWQEKLDLSDGRFKKARGRGRKEGIIVGGIITAVIVYLIKK